MNKGTLTVVVTWHILPPKKAKAGRHRGVVDTLLTLVIALGGIATGIGAIWAAVVARRQAQVTERSLEEQRRFLKEQNETARRQTQLTEQSLAQTERSLAEQSEHSRLTLELDLLTRLEDRFESPRFSSSRKNAAKHVLDKLDNFFADSDTVEEPRLNRATLEVANFFEGVGYFQSRGALQDESVLHSFGQMAQVYWSVLEPAIQKMREENEDPAIYEDFERLNRLVDELNSERGFKSPTQEQLRQIMQFESVMGEEPPTTTG